MVNGIDVLLLAKLKKGMAQVESDYEAMESALQSFPSGYTYKDTVESASDLPATATAGDFYVVKDESNAEYYWNGTAFVCKTPLITTEQIDSLF